MAVVLGELTERIEFFLNELSVLCGVVPISPSFWTLPSMMRKRALQPNLRKSEVLTRQVVGEDLGIDTGNIITHSCR